MRKNSRGFGSRNLGCLIILLGVFVLLALILPPTFWWFFLGAVLIVTGIWVCRAR